MFDDTNILVVEDESLIAEDIADWVKAAGGRVVGPARTVAQALELIGTTPVDGAILDGHLEDRDVTPVAQLLVSRNVPLIVYSGIGLPDELAAAHPDIPLILKPAPAARVVRQLAVLFRERLQSSPAPTDEIEFRIIRIFVDNGSRTGRSAYSGGTLIGILIPVTAEEEGESGAGGWYLEAGFGPCSLMNVGPPPIFADLGKAATWFTDSLAGCGRAAVLQ
jgi:CheY-like chemotaxis protein